MSLVVYEPPGAVSVEGLEDELARAFEVMRDAIERGDAVVVSLEEQYVQAVCERSQAALAHGLIGLARASRSRGREPGWRVAVLSSPSGVDPDERVRWIEQLAASDAASGALVRLGGEHLGRVQT